MPRVRDMHPRLEESRHNLEVDVTRELEVARVGLRARNDAKGIASG